MITSLGGQRASPLGLAARPNQDSRCVRRAFDRGINYFFFYGPGSDSFIRPLARLIRKQRDETIVATGSGARRHRGLMTSRRKIIAALGTEMIDIFFAEYISPMDEPATIFGKGGTLEELQQWKADGSIRYVGATAHDRGIAKRLAADPRVDVLMHRFNMAHRKAAVEVFPTAIRANTPVVAFTATRWGTLLEPREDWTGDPPNAADCYRFCLAQPAVQVALTAPKSIGELDENLGVFERPRMSKRDCRRWERFGDLLYTNGQGKFETEWP